MDAEWDYECLNRWPNHPTVTPFERSGTWDYPIVVLETPNGFRDYGGAKPLAKYLLIEGHQRLRYLNALVAREETEHLQSDHCLFLLNSDGHLESKERGHYPDSSTRKSET